MDSGYDIHLRCQRTDLGDLSAVGALVILQNHLAHSLFLILVDRLPKDGKPLLLLRKGLLQSGGDILDIELSGLLVVGEHRLLHLLGRNQPLDLLEHLLGDGAAGIFMLGLAHLGNNLVDEGDYGLVHLMGLIDGLDHLVLGNLVGPRLDHDHLLFRGGHGEVQIAVLPLLLRRIDDKLSVNHAHLGHGAGTVKGNVRNTGCDGCSQHCHQLRAAGRVHAHDHIVQGYIIAIVLGEKGPHGPINDAAGQNGVLAGLSLSLVEASGDLAHRIQLLFKLHAQREEVDPLSGLVRRCGRTEHHRVPIMHEGASVGLLAHTVDIHLQSTSA